MTEPQETHADRVFHRFLAMQQFLRRHARTLIDEQGLMPRELAILHYLLETESATVGQVGAYLHKSPSTTSALLAQMEEKGHISRTRSEQDNRVVLVALTVAGCRMARETPLGGLPLLRRRLAALSPERLVEIDGVLVEILDLMEAGEIE